MIDVGERQEEDGISRYLQYLSVDDTGSNCFINGKSEWVFLLPDLLSRKIVEDLVYEHCQKYDIDYVDPDNISNWATHVVQHAFRLRVVDGNKKKKVGDKLRTRPDDPRIPNRDCAEFVIRSVKKTIKQEDSLVRQVLYTCWSANTKDPINLGIMAPTSEGKTYPVIETLKFVPNEDVWKIGQMSTKVLVRQKGILVDRDGVPLKPVLKEIDQQIVKLKGTSSNKGKDHHEQIDQLNERKNQMLEDSRMLIDLSGKTLVFLEPPQRELWNLLKPILSHDTEEIEYPYVDRNDRTGFVAKRVVVRGYPACIFCSAKDESSWQVWEEIASRFLITSPNMNKTKYEEANILIAQRKSLPAPILQKILISDEEVQLARDCYQFVKQNIRQLTGSENMNDAVSSAAASNSVWIPYGLILGEALPSDRGIDNRAATRIFSLLNIVTLTHADVRPKLIYDDNKLVIATLNDLREVLHITQNLSGMPAYKLQFFKDIFCKLYKSKTEVDSKGDKQEDRIGITTKELCEYYKQQTSKSITSNNMKTTYLNELQNAGYIDCELSKIDNRQYIFWQVIEPSYDEGVGEIKNPVVSDAMDYNLRYARINLPRNCRNIPGNWLLSATFELREYPVRANKFVLLGKDEKPVTIKEFIKEYENSDKLTHYFVKRNYPTIFGELKPIMQDANDFSHSDPKKLSIAEKSIEEDNLESVDKEIGCEYCNKRFATAIDVVRHSVAVHPGRAIVAALLKRGIDVPI
jgi:hypothetical protein